MHKAVFLDRDGVLVVERGAITQVEQFVIINGVSDALWMFKRAGYLLILVTNQAVVARGLLAEEELRRLHAEMQVQLSANGAPNLDAIYSCPHHPNATLQAFKVECECRKPRPGMLLKAAQEHQIDLSKSYMIGDRQSDIAAGKQAGCQTILVETGAHLEPPIESSHPISFVVYPDYVDADLLAAAKRIVSAL
jgi:D-glycero-D-manno-heptose 1,7-bisphosphate phosphatase